jgi:hypothetical protein
MGTFKDANEKKVSVEAGQVAVLDMPAIESHPAPLVTWITDGGAQLYDRKFAVTADNQLIILDANPSDQKAYRCVQARVEDIYDSLLGCENMQSRKVISVLVELATSVLGVEESLLVDEGSRFPPEHGDVRLSMLIDLAVLSGRHGGFDGVHSDKEGKVFMGYNRALLTVHHPLSFLRKLQMQPLPCCLLLYVSALLLSLNVEFTSTICRHEIKLSRVLLF